MSYTGNNTKIMGKVLIVANWDWVIYNFRLALARSLREQGYTVVFVSPDGKYIEELENHGFRWVEWPLARRSLNPFAEIQFIWKLAKIYLQESPDLIHHDTIKPNLYGPLAAQLNVWRGVWTRPPQLLNSFMGIGFLFSDRPKARLLRPLVLPLMRFAMCRNHVFTTFSNQSDLDTFTELGLVEPGQTQLMVSEFVNTDRFLPTANEQDQKETVRVLMAARLLWDKGVEEFVSAARQLKDRNVPVEFWLAGEPDTETPGFVPEEQLREWDQSGVINWLGYCSDMPQVLQQVDVAALPTHYNEGLPRFLVEAASSGLPLIATDIEACRRVVENATNGFLIPKRSPTHLAQAVEKVVQNPKLRKDMGKSSREKARSEFAEQEIVGEWYDLYERLLNF